MVAVAFALVIGTALAVENWLNAPPERSARADPLASVRQDRRASLGGAFAGGAVVGLLGAPAVYVGAVTGDVLGQGLAGWWGTSGTAELAIDLALSDTDGGLPIIIGTAAVLPAVIVFALMLLTRAWPRFVVLRVVLAAQGRLPLRMLAFLADARDRELIRQTGDTYEFRHIRLQERLATRGLPTTGRGRNSGVEPTDRRRRLRRLAVPVVGMLLLAATLVAASATQQYLRCGTESGRSRVFTDGESACLGVIPEEEWDRFAEHPLWREHPVTATFGLLAVGNGRARKARAAHTVAVAAQWRHQRTPGYAGLLRQLAGVVIAQEHSLRAGRPFEVLLVNTESGDGPATAAELTITAHQQRPWMGEELAYIHASPTWTNLRWYDRTGDLAVGPTSLLVPATWPDRNALARYTNSPDGGASLTAWTAAEGRPILTLSSGGRPQTEATTVGQLRLDLCELGGEALIYDGLRGPLEDLLTVLATCDAPPHVVVANPYVVSELISRQPLDEYRAVAIEVMAPVGTTPTKDCAHLSKVGFYQSYREMFPADRCVAEVEQALWGYRAGLTAVDPKTQRADQNQSLTGYRRFTLGVNAAGTDWTIV